MEQLTVASVQQKMYLPSTLGELRVNLQRFLRVTANKQAKLIVFPELGGLTTISPILSDFRSNLLKRADMATRREANFWQKFVGGLSSGMAHYLRADLRRNAAALLDVSSGELWDAYLDVYGGLAKEFNITIVGPSAYLPDPLDGVIRNLSVVFGANGELLGTHAKVMLHPTDLDMAQPGHTWDVIHTDTGSIGLMLGGDVLYPEVGRLLAYQGADVLVTQAACLDMTMYNKIRAGVLARMQDNQLFAVASFLVGPNVFTLEKGQEFTGKSAIFAPQELTPRSNGVLVEMGGFRSEGVLAADWDFVALKELWDTSDTPLRRNLTSTELSGVIGEIYTRIQLLPPVADRPLLQTSDVEQADSTHDTVITLDDLTVLSSHESQFIGEVVTGDLDADESGRTETSVNADVPDDSGSGFLSSDSAIDEELPASAETDSNDDSAEDETDEYDSLPTTP